MSKQLRVNPIACTGHGLCAELLPELVTLDEWGYPVLAG
jgi:ferredoxin